MGLPTNEKPGAELVKDRSFQSLLEKMDDDADKAEAQWKSQSSDSDVARFPSTILSDYKNDGAQMLRARGNFNMEWNKVVVGRGDVKRLLSTYDAYSLYLGALQESNAQFKALLEVDVAGKVAAWLAVAMAVANATRSRVGDLQRQLTDLKGQLARAEHDARSLQVKRVLNGLLSAVTLLLVPETALAGVAVAAVGITGHLLIDYTFGKNTVSGAVTTVAGDLPEAAHHLAEGTKKFAGAVAALRTLQVDSAEINEADEVVEKFESKLEKAVSDHEAMVDKLEDLAPKVREWEGGMKMLNAAVARALQNRADAKKNYEAIKNTIRKAL